MAGEIVVTGQEQGLSTAAALIESARAYAEAGRSDATKAAYRRDWLAFSSWCEGRGLSSLPAQPETVALYLTDLANNGAKPASLARYLASISQAHKAAKLDSPRSAQCVQAVLKGIRRIKGVAQRQASPILPAHLRAMVESLPDSLLGLRDRALLLVGFSGAFRRSELASLTVSDLRFVEEGMVVALRRSKTNQEGRTEEKAIPIHSNLASCPVRAMRAWLEAAGITEGPVFRQVAKGGRVGSSELSGTAIALIVKRCAEAAGLDPAPFSGHSMRVGLVTAAKRAGKADHKIMEITGHKSRKMIDHYTATVERFVDNAAAGLLW